MTVTEDRISNIIQNFMHPTGDIAAQTLTHSPVVLGKEHESKEILRSLAA